MNKNTTTYKVKIVNLTPSKAKELLANNTHNRKVTQLKVDTWAESMRRGEWVMNAEPIKIAVDGTILDGQHRILAVIQSGVTIPVMIVTGLPFETQDTMDIGRKRTLGDVLSIHGEKNANNLAAILTASILWDKIGPSGAFNTARNNFITNGEAQEYLKQHPSIREVPTIVSAPAKNSGISQRVLGTLYIRFRDAEPTMVDDFIEHLSSGTDLSKGDPILVLRKTVKRLRDLNHGTQVSPRYIAAITIKAWNKWLNGEKVGLLRFNSNGESKETFPEIQRSLASMSEETEIEVEA